MITNYLFLWLLCGFIVVFCGCFVGLLLFSVVALWVYCCFLWLLCGFIVVFCGCFVGLLLFSVVALWVYCCFLWLLCGFIHLLLSPG